jgi:hypothetical protein
LVGFDVFESALVPQGIQGIEGVQGVFIGRIR